MPAPTPIHQPRPADPAVLEADATAFQSMRPRLLAVAYRVLGSWADADDVVQDTWLRWQRTDRRDVRDPAAFLATVATRLAINVSQSARARHETVTSLPEPAGVAADPGLEAERRDTATLAIRVLTERLTPAERAAYMLRVAFDYPYRRIAEVTGLSEANARQLVGRARGHLSEEGRRNVSAAAQGQLLDAFAAAARTGDLHALEQTLADDVAGRRDEAPAQLRAA
jgi:RNA polymerase sigma-70 factor (ECF subfamily)